MPDYSNGKIYTIRSYRTDQLYVGSTVQPLYKRLHAHRKDYKRYQNDKGYYTTSFEILKFEDCYIELIEEFPCENKQQLEKREGELIRTNACVNKRIEGRTRAEYREDNKEHIIEQKKQWYEVNKERINEKNKQWYEANKEHISEQKKQYRQVNKDRINEKVNCECSGKYTMRHKSQHMKTIKHQRYLEAQQ